MTSQKPQSRWQGGNGYKGNSYFTRSIKKYGWDNFRHDIILTDLTEEQAKSLEKIYIMLYQSNKRAFGFNISSGGESKSGTTISEYQKQRIREGTKNKVISDETRKKLSEKSKATWKNPEHVLHMRTINLGEKNPQYGVKRTKEDKLKRGAKQILQYDDNMNLIAEYISLHDAYNQTKIDRDGISKCCKGIYKQYRGYLWRYKEA